VEGMVDSSKTGVNSGSCEELLVGDEEGERSVASIEDQIRIEMTIYEVSGSDANIFCLRFTTILMNGYGIPYDQSIMFLNFFFNFKNLEDL
jgi:hypothetical protein